MDNTKTTQRYGFVRIGLIALTLLCSASYAEDPCISILGTVDPMSAAALSAKKQQAEQQAQEKFRQGLGQQQIYGADSTNPIYQAPTDPNKQNDAQYTAEKAGEGDQIGGDYTAMSAPIFAAGAATAAAKMNFPAQDILMQCAAKRGAQGAVQQQTAQRNKEIAVRATQEDNPNNSVAGFNVKVIEAGVQTSTP